MQISLLTDSLAPAANFNIIIYEVALKIRHFTIWQTSAIFKF
jgi:hypothetical protein